MPKIRSRRAVPDGYLLPEDGSLSIDELSDNLNGTTGQPQSFPGVPMNPQHRFCTPPPLDPRFADPPPSERDDFPQFTSRPPSPDDFDELTGARPPLPPRLGSKGNPIVVEEDASEPSLRLEQRNTATDGAPRRRTTGSLRPIPSTSQARPPATESPRTSSSSRKPSSKATKPSKNSEVLKKIPAHVYSPTKSSPLSQVAYRAPSERPASPTLLPRLR
ncbi:hypothetical protein C8T65DRAFT_758801 [Cerioporus squamosus]|nr:hypothetical protein C8T65DRAFT_758801 [Cerioporus squamosus]